ncbi:MAG: hypothetical protein GKR89_08185 [Candidatus Latescibacteria bacterium]|nr:hypothetical protein [Candidatus Latescibacterota bacterium]
MVHRLFILLLSALPLVVLAAPGAALTIYRIGGRDLPPPQVEGSFEFVQLDWRDVEAGRHGRADLIGFGDDAIGPQRLDPQINLTPTIKETGGEVLNFLWNGWRVHTEIDALMFDRDLATSFLGDGHFAAHWPFVKALIFDLNAPYHLERIRFFPRQRHLEDRFLQTFKIGINDGDPLKDGSRELNIGTSTSFFDFDIIYNFSENTDSFIELDLPQVPIRRILFHAEENVRGIWEIAEFEIYGSGYVPTARYISNVIDLGAAASLGAVRWTGHRDGGAQIDLSMRSGLDDDPNTYWRSTFRGDERTRFDNLGRQLTLASYNKLGRGEQAGITHDTENWAFWGSTYDFANSTDAMVGNGPQRYVQLRADFTSSQAVGARLDYVEFAVSIPPLASQVVAEIVPTQAPPGQAVPFTFKLKAEMAPADKGFDRIGIDTPAKPEGVDQVRISAKPVDFEVVQLDTRGLVVQIPRVDLQRSAELIEVDFRAEIFKFGTVFSGRVFDSLQPNEVPQSVTAGDADFLDGRNRLNVDLDLGRGQTIQAFNLNPPVFSPNGDGINDQVQLEYDLINLNGSVPVRGELYDLSGRSLGIIHRQQVQSGRFAFPWDGRDAAGRLVPPGLYILELTVVADKGQIGRQTVVRVAY